MAQVFTAPAPRLHSATQREAPTGYARQPRMSPGSAGYISESVLARPRKAKRPRTASISALAMGIKRRTGHSPFP